MKKREARPQPRLGAPWRWRLGPWQRLWMALAFAVYLGLFVPMVDASAAEREASEHGFAPQPGLSIDRAVHLVREKVDGRVLSVTPIDGGRRGYEVRVLLQEGRVKTIHLDRDGRIREP